MIDAVKIVLNSGEKVDIFNVPKNVLKIFVEEDMLKERVFEVRKETGEWMNIKVKEIREII